MRRAELLLLALLPLVVIPAAAEVYLRFFEKDYAARLSQCLELSPEEHHRFRANCEEELATPAGKVKYSINEDGLRDAPRAQFQNAKTVLLLGDSKVEGWWLSPEETLARQLEKRLPGWKILNGGIRYSSPAMLRIQLERYRKNYAFEAIVLAINGTDVADERLAYALASKNESGLPSALSLRDTEAPAWIEWLDKITLRSSQVVRLIRLAHYDRHVIRLLNSQEANQNLLCGSIAAIAGNAGVPFYTVVLPLGPQIQKFPYMGEAAEPAAFAEMVNCARSHSRALIDLRPILPNDPALYWNEHRNMNAAGTALTAEKLAPLLAPHLRPKK